MDEEEGHSVSNLRARFEQLSNNKSKASPPIPAKPKIISETAAPRLTRRRSSSTPAARAPSTGDTQAEIDQNVRDGITTSAPTSAAASAHRAIAEPRDEPTKKSLAAQLDDTSRDARPIPPAATRPTRASSFRTPPPVPLSRKAAAKNGVDVPQQLNSNPSTALLAPDSPAVRPAVKSLASRFGAASAPPTVVSSPSSSPTLERSLSAGVHVNVETQAAAGSGRPLGELTSEPRGSTPPADFAVPNAKPRPVIPPRPVIAQSAEVQTRLVPPPPPTRSATSPINAAINLPSTLAADLSRDRAVSDSHATALPAAPTPPPPPRKLPPPAAQTTSPAVSRSNSMARMPPRPTSTAAVVPSSSDVESPYVPPPPPSRTAGHIAPRPTGISTPSAARGEDAGSSDDDEEDATASKAQELPDATFANRRPPLLRNRKPVQPSSHVYSFAVRGTRVVTGGQHHLHLWHASGSASETITLPGNEHKITAVEFRPTSESDFASDERYVWAGTKEGHLFEVDLVELRVVSARQHIHLSPVVAIFRLGRAMLTLEDNGKLIMWGEPDSPDAPLLAGTFKPQRTADKQTFSALVGHELWTASGPVTKQGSTALAARCPQIRVYDPTGDVFSVMPRPINTPESAGRVGAVTASALVPSQPDTVYLGQDNGWISTWTLSTHSFVSMQRVSPYMITALAGVGKHLWAGFRTGFIYVYDVSRDPWTVHKAWKAHKDPVQKIVVDSAALWTDGCLQVASFGSDMIIQLWDGLLRDDWLDAELNLRQPDFCTYRSIRTLCISWNIDASRPDDLKGSRDNVDFLHDVLLSTESPDIISFGFQEMIDLEDKKLAAKSMLLGKKKADGQKFTESVSSNYRLWHDKLVHAVRLAMPPECPYTVVHVGDMVGLFTCIFVKSSESSRLRDIAKINVKTGMGGRTGNKGAVACRFVIDDTSLCFVNCHLAAGQSHRRQRDHDLVDILEDKSSFSGLGSTSPGAYLSGGDGSTVFDHELCVLSGDLNYRIDAPRDNVLAAAIDGTYAVLLPSDQLNKGLATNPTFRLKSFKEPPIKFAPTYKYDPGTDNYDSSAKRRSPAWCDRILYRADRIEKVTPVPNSYRRWEVDISDHRPVSSAFDMQVKSILSPQRAQVWAEIEAAWFGVESQLLAAARDYYAGK